MDDVKYCPRIYHGLTLDKISDSNISYSACCWTKEHIRSTKIEFDHPGLGKLRDVNQQNILPANYCNSCIEQERSHKHSMRQGYLKIHGEPTYTPSVQYLDINIDYTCNLACVTCGPDLSTTWRNELKIKGVQTRPNIDQWIESKINTLDLTQLKEVRIWGGEPLLTNTHKKILEFIVEKGIASNVRLMYNTNGTQRISDDTKKLIEKFKFARISFSIDDIGPGFEYLRYPAKWDEVETNLIWWKNNLPHNSMLSLTVTASILNVLYLDRVFNWYQEHFNKSCFGDEIEMYVHQAFGTYGLESMPAAMIGQLLGIENYSQPWIQKLQILGSKPFQLDTVVNTLRRNDTRRNLYLKDVYPEVAKLIGY